MTSRSIGQIANPLHDALRTTAVSVLEQLANHQNPDGGFPETYPEDGSGCWTTAEVYGALATIEGLPPTLHQVLDRAESYLVGVLQRHGGQGLPYRDASAGNIRPVLVVDPTAAFLIGWTRRHPAETSLKGSISRWLRGARASGAGSGWGICAADGARRTYSTVYAALALGPSDTTRDVEGLLREQSAGDGFWRFRSQAPASRLGTALAIDVLLDSTIECVDRLELGARWLLSELACERLDEEDSFFTPEGYKLSFVYEPRLVCMASLMRFAARRSRGLAESGLVGPMVRAVSVMAARYTLHLSETGRPCPESSGLRIWHYIELAWGLSGILRSWDEFPNDLKEQLAAEGALIRAETRRSFVASAMPWPLRRQASIAGSPTAASASAVRAVSTHLEQVFSFSEILLLCDLRRRGAAGVAAVQVHLREARRGLSDLRRLRRRFRRLAGKEVVPELAIRLANELGLLLGSAQLTQLKELRDDDSHGWPLTDPQRALLMRDSWADIMLSLRALRSMELLVVERLGHDAASSFHVYQWAEVERRTPSGTSFLHESLETSLWQDGEELSVVYARDSVRLDSSPLPLGHFVLFGYCRGCVCDQLFLYRRLTWTDEETLVLTSGCASGCGTWRRLELPRLVLGGPDV